MPFVARLLPCVVLSAVLALSGCTNPNAKMARLERENSKLQAEKQKLSSELAALRNKLNAAHAQAQHWEGVYGNTQKQLRAHIEELTQAQIRRQIVQRALTLAQTQLQAASKGQKQAAAQAETALRLARATAEEPPAKR
jgi:outer membrane murein-binding lipoprotein Lpp